MQIPLPTLAQISRVAGTGCLGSTGKVLGTPLDPVLISPLSLPSQTPAHGCFRCEDPAGPTYLPAEAKWASFRRLSTSSHSIPGCPGSEPRITARKTPQQEEYVNSSL